MESKAGQITSHWKIFFTQLHSRHVGIWHLHFLIFFFYARNKPYFLTSQMGLQCRRRLSRTSVALTPPNRCSEFVLQFLTAANHLPNPLPIILLLSRCSHSVENEKVLGLKIRNWGESQKTGNMILSARKETETERRLESKRRNTHAGTVDKDVRNRMQA